MRLFRKGSISLGGIVFLLACGTSEVKFPEQNFKKLDGIVEEMVYQGEMMAANMDTIAHYYESALSKRDSILKFAPSSPYRFNGALSTNLPGQDTSLSSVVIFNTTPHRVKAEEEVLLTNFLDPLFSDFIKDNPRTAQIYSNSAMQVSRVYPAYDVKNIIDANLDVTSFNFYYEGDLEHNPSKGIVWIPEAYVDPAGKGWILSVVHPVYDGDELFAVLGVDFTVTDVIQNYLDAVEGEILMVNTKGDIVAGKAGAIEYLSMPPLMNHVYRETVQSDYFRVSDFNLFSSKSREVREMAKQFLLEKKDRFEFLEEPNLSGAICVPFQGIDWFLIEVFPNY